MKRPFCLNSRRWLDFVFTNTPKGCPVVSHGEACKYQACGYYEEREETAAYKRKMAVLKSYSKGRATT